MKRGLIFFCMILTALSAVAHPFHVSYCDIIYDKEEKMLKIVHAIFIDDLEQAVLNEEGVEMNLLDGGAGIETDQVLEEYLLDKFHIKLDGEKYPAYYLGMEVNRSENVVYVFMEVVNIRNPFHQIGVSNRVLMDEFDDQENIINLQDGKQTFTLTREDFFKTVLL